MDEFWILTLLSLAMFIGCYAAGSIPLALTLSEGVLRKVTTFGAGLLIGTALIVIIPEGVESLFGEVLHTHEAHHTHTTTSPISTVASVEPVLRQPRAVENAGNIKDDPSSVVLDLTESFTVDQLQLMMGASLVLGFIFMLMIDQVGGGGHSHTHSTDVEVGSGGKHNRNRLTATIGLVVHAAADGLALGAAAGLSKVDVELIIFLAIMLHKAPAAFGFTSFLIHECLQLCVESAESWKSLNDTIQLQLLIGYDRLTAKKHLLAFALAAPVAAFVAYFGLVRVMYVVQVPITGIAMLFSAGTFLYVATVHVLIEVTRSHSSTEPSSAPSNSNLSKFELLLVILGALLPLGFNVLHSH